MADRLEAISGMNAHVELLRRRHESPVHRPAARNHEQGRDDRERRPALALIERAARAWMLPAAGCAVLALATVTLRRRRRQRLDVGPVSDAWLRDHEYTSGHHDSL